MSLPVPEGLQRLVRYHLEHKEACIFLGAYWRSSRSIHDLQHDEQWQVYDKALEHFFIRGQKEGFFKVGPSAISLHDLFGYTIVGFAESALVGRVASVGLEDLVLNLLIGGMSA